MVFRTIRSLRGRMPHSVLYAARTPIRADILRRYEPGAQIQRAQVVERKRWGWGKIFIGVVGFHVFVNYVIGPLGKTLDEIEQSLPPELLDGEEGVETATYIPFPGTTKLALMPPYRGREPEVAGYVEFSKQWLNQEVRDRLTDDLTEYARRYLSETVNYGRPETAPKDVVKKETRTSYIRIKYPMSPPPMFVRSGLEITDDHVSWTNFIPVDSRNALRAERILYPTIAAQGAIAYLKTLFAKDLQLTVQECLIQSRLQMIDHRLDSGWEDYVAHSIARARNGVQRGMHAVLNSNMPLEKVSPDTLQRLGNMTPQEAVDYLHKQNEASSKENATDEAVPRQRQIQDMEARKAQLRNALQQSEAEKVSKARKAIFGGVFGDEDPLAEYPAMDKLFNVILQRMRMARTMAWYTVKHNWRHIVDLPPNGAVLMTGMVDLELPEWWATVEIEQAYYDPKEQKFDEKSMVFSLRLIKPKANTYSAFWDMRHLRQAAQRPRLPPASSE